MPDAPSRRRRLIAAVALAALVLALGAWLWSAAFRLSAEERRLVGTWRPAGGPVQLGAAPVLVEFEYRPDRTYRVRNLDPETGAVVCEWMVRWRLRDGRYQAYWLQNPLDGRGFTHREPAKAVTWDGLNCVRLEGERSEWHRVPAPGTRPPQEAE